MGKDDEKQMGLEIGRIKNTMIGRVVTQCQASRDTCSNYG